MSLDIWGLETEAPGYVAQLKRCSARTPAIQAGEGSTLSL